MTLARLERQITECRRCPRLVAWREQVAVAKRAAFRDDVYWGKPVPGFGDPDARLLVVGLAPAAHGANRTGRMFTGDRSGDWLYRALFKGGMASRPDSALRHVCECDRPLCSAREQAHHGGASSVSTVARAGDGAHPRPESRACPRRACVRPGTAHPRRRWGGSAATSSPVRPWSRGGSTTGRTDCCRQLPPEPAEHLHRATHRGDARRCHRARCDARRHTATVISPVSAVVIGWRLERSRCSYLTNRHSTS